MHLMSCPDRGSRITEIHSLIKLLSLDQIIRLSVDIRTPRERVSAWCKEKRISGEGLESLSPKYSYLASPQTTTVHPSIMPSHIL